MVGTHLPIKQKGFTIIELLVAIALFSLLVVGAVGSMVTASVTARVTKAEANLNSNLVSIIDSMVNDLQLADEVGCGGLNQDCENGTSLFIKGPGNRITTYSRNQNQFTKTVDGVSFPLLITPGTSATDLSFRVQGAFDAGDTQPLITVSISALSSYGKELLITRSISIPTVAINTLSGSRCIYNPGPNNWVVIFNQDRLRANRNNTDLAQGIQYKTDIPTGTYRVFLQVYEYYEERSEAPASQQSQEFLRVVLRDVNNSILAISPRTLQDLPDGVDEANWAGEVGTINIAGLPAKSVQPVHGLYNPLTNNFTPSSPQVNSVEAVCASFERI